jgi:hypothetical protein
VGGGEPPSDAPRREEPTRAGQTDGTASNQARRDLAGSRESRYSARLQTGGRPMTISDEIEAFMHQHRGDGQLAGDATEPLPNGYQLTITCPCGVMCSFAG